MNQEAPAREQPERQPFPWVCATIIATSALLYALRVYMMARWPPKTGADAYAIIMKLGALTAPAVRDREWWRLLTHAFVHGSAMHIFFNMLALNALGVPLERRVGSVRFFELSLVTCLGGGAFVVLFAKPESVTVGSSGMILGYAGALMVMLSREQSRQLMQMLLLTAVISFLPSVSWQAHLGGFLFGLLCGLQLRRDPDSFSSRAPILVGLALVLALRGAYRG